MFPSLCLAAVICGVLHQVHSEGSWERDFEVVLEWFSLNLEIRKLNKNNKRTHKENLISRINVSNGAQGLGWFQISFVKIQHDYGQNTVWPWPTMRWPWLTMVDYAQTMVWPCIWSAPERKQINKTQRLKLTNPFKFKRKDNDYCNLIDCTTSCTYKRSCTKRYLQIDLEET